VSTLVRWLVCLALWFGGCPVPGGLCDAARDIPSGLSLDASVVEYIKSEFGVMVPSLRPGDEPGTVALPLVANETVGSDSASIAGSSGASDENAMTLAAHRPGVVTAEGTMLIRDGQPFHFLGVNATYLMEPYFPQSEIEPILAYLGQTEGVNAVRFWILPGQDLDRLEYILDLGSEYGLTYIVALQNYYYYKDQNWFATNYLTEDLPHVREVVSRFRDRPEILMWELMNEPGCGPENGSWECADHMYRWAEHVSSIIKEIDPVHLVSLGTTFRKWTEAEQANYDRMHALATVDVVSIHRPVGDRMLDEMRLAEILGKPVFVGEAYLIAYDKKCGVLNDRILGERAALISRDLAWSFEHGLDGYLLWEHDPGAVRKDDGTIQWFCGELSYLGGDPVYDVFKSFLARFWRGEGCSEASVGSD